MTECSELHQCLCLVLGLGDAVDRRLPIDGDVRLRIDVRLRVDAERRAAFPPGVGAKETVIAEMIVGIVACR